MALNEESRRKLICEFYTKNPSLKKSNIVRHFTNMNFNRSSVYSVLQRIENNESMERRKGSGRKSSLSDPKNRQKLKNLTEGKIAKSYRELGKILKCDKKTIKKCITEMNIKKKSRKTRPKVSEIQAKKQKQCIAKLVKTTFASENNVIVIQDDESYFTVDGNEWQPKFFYESEKNKAQEKVRFKGKTKYPEKVLLWLAISERGVSEPHFFKSGLAVNKDIYIKCCIPKLKNFIDTYHKKCNIVFWSDLASAHYAKDTQDKLKSLKIPCIQKDENPPNIPQLRPIEDFWAALKRKVYVNGFTAKSSDGLVRKIKMELKNLDTSGFRNAMAKVPKNIRKAHRVGVQNFLH